MIVRLNFCFETSCTLLQYFDFSPPGPSSHAILVQTEPRLQDFKTSRLYYKFSKEYFSKCPGTVNSCS